MYSYVQLWTLVGSSCRTDQVTGLVEVYIVLCTSVDFVGSSWKTDQVTGLVEVCDQLCTSVDIGSSCKTDQVTGLAEVYIVQLRTSVDVSRVRL